MRVAFRIKQDVSGLNISVKNSALVCVMHSACQLRYEFCRWPTWHRLPFNNLIELSAFNQLHAEITGTIALPDFMDRNNEWMIQSRGSLSFEPKTLYVSFGRPMTEANDF
jgi:hypothetical protein